MDRAEKLANTGTSPTTMILSAPVLLGGETDAVFRVFTAERGGHADVAGRSELDSHTRVVALL